MVFLTWINNPKQQKQKKTWASKLRLRSMQYSFLQMFYILEI